MLLISSSEDHYGLSGILVSARGLPLTRPDVPWAPFFARSSAFPFTSREETHDGPSSSQATHPFAGCETCPCASRPLV
jgi:hypothetical protein